VKNSKKDKTALQISRCMLNKYLEKLRKSHQNIETALYFSLLFLLAIIIFRKWLFTDKWPAGGDVLGWISRAYLFGKDFRWLYIWRPYSFGFVENINSMDFFLMLIYHLLKDAPATIKAFTFIMFLVAGFTIYAFTYKYNKNHLASLAASLIYCLNPWIFSQLTEMHIDIFFSYALAPLIFLFLDKTLENKKLKDALILTLLLFILVTGFHPQCLVIYGLSLILFTIIFLLSSARKRVLCREAHSLIKVFLPIMLLLPFLSSFNLLPLLLNLKAQYYSSTFGYPLEASMPPTYKNMIDAFILRAIESWGYISIVDVYSEISLIDFPVNALLLIIFTAAFCIVFIRRDRHTIFFALSTIISSFIAKGPNPPFGYIFTWMWFNIPHFATFRAASRAAMLTALSQAFLASTLVAEIIKYIQKKIHLRPLETYIKVRVIGETGERHITISLDVFNRALRIIHNILYYSAIISLILILLSGPISCFYFLSQGLEVYTPPKKYLEPYKWLATKPEDFKVVTVSSSPSEWENQMPRESDFAFSAMRTSIGWGHDIGYDSSFIHDKSTLQDGGWEPSARAFMDYLRYHVVRKHLTDDFLKIIGAFNYKYVVLPEYLTNETRSFFLRQEGYRVAANSSSYIILQNERYSPRFFIPSQVALIVGGLESFVSLCKVDSFNLNQTALIFLNYMHPPSNSLIDALNISDMLIFVNSDIMDALIPLLSSEAIFIRASDYGVLSINYTKYWVRSSSWREIGALTVGGETLSTCGKNCISIPFEVMLDGTYDVWIRIGFAKHRGLLRVFIDDEEIGKIRPTASLYVRLMWVKITSIFLNNGKHIITLLNDGSGYNDIDAIMIIRPESIQSKLNYLTEILKEFSGRIIYVLEAENTFTLNPLARWEVSMKPYEGLFLRIYDCENISPEGRASASSSGTWDAETLWPNLANDGDPNTRWASKPGAKMPQWLMIEWDTPREIAGVRIMFERAYAREYAIQTWDGKAWVDQVRVRGNTLLNCTHVFSEPIKTSKVRIYVTDVTEAYGLVSIWEFEVLAIAPPPSTELFIPREGYYSFMARVIWEANSTIPYLKIDDEIVYLQPLNNSGEEGILWLKSKPILLNPGNHTLKIFLLNPLEKMNLDQIFLYSVRDGEEDITIHDLFRVKSKVFPLKYEKISPCEYRVNLESDDSPFLLVFSESYHPLWRAYLANGEISPIQLYALVNGFYINSTGKISVTIYFMGQTYVNIGLRISAITLIAVIIMVFMPHRWIERIGKIVNARLRRLVRVGFDVKEGVKD